MALIGILVVAGAQKLEKIYLLSFKQHNEVFIIINKQFFFYFKYKYLHNVINVKWYYYDCKWLCKSIYIVGI